MDYTERISKKDGKRIVYCKFDDLLVEAFNAHSLEEAKSFINIGNGEYQCPCPFCRLEGHQSGFTGRKLYINDEYTLGHCFVCHRAFMNVNDELKFDIPDLDFMVDTSGLHKSIVPYERINDYYKFSEDLKDGFDYLISRHGFLGELSKCLKFRYTEELGGGIVIPFIYHGNLIYYQVRYFKSKKTRYFLPPMPKGTKPPYIIENGDCKRLVVCEGVFDAISLLIQAPSWTPVAVLGSMITDYQLNFLREYVPEEIVVYMDDTEKSIQVQKKIKSVIDYCPVTIIPSDGTDPEENMLKKLRWGASVNQLQIKKLKRN